MEGAILAGRYVAAQVRGLVAPQAPAPASPPPAPSVTMQPPVLAPAQVKQALALLCQMLHAGSAIDVPAWEAPPAPWQKNPAALQAWVAEALVGALAMTGLVSPPPQPPTPEWFDELTQATIAFVGAGYAASIADPASYPAADQPEVRSVQELTRIASALMRLKSSEPFLVAPPPPVDLGAPDPSLALASPRAAPPRPGRFTCLSRMLRGG